jgi:hypothetical protein
MTLRKSVSIIFAVAVIFLEAGISAGRAEVAPEDTINYAYATWIGTGAYKVKDQNLYVLRGPFSYTLRAPEDDKVGVDLLFPATLGLVDFTDDNTQVGTFTFVPGVMVVYPVKKNWLLKPFGQLGVGRDFSGSDLAYIYGAGIKSLATFAVQDMELDLGNQLMFADQSQGGGGSDDGFSMFEIGLNLRRPLSFNIQSQSTKLNVFFVYTRFINDLKFIRLFKSDLKIRNLYKFGVALGAEKTFSILGIKFRGVGIDFTIGKGFAGIGLTTGFPF